MERLWVNSRLVSSRQLNPHRYTLTHSDQTGELSLVIDTEYDDCMLTEERDEVLGEWLTYNSTHYYFLAAVRVD